MREGLAGVGQGGEKIHSRQGVKTYAEVAQQRGTAPAMGIGRGIHEA